MAMALTAFAELLSPTFQASQIQFDVPMSTRTSLRLGGDAKLLASVQNEEQIAFALALCKKHGIPVFILGNGSNVLVKQGGIDGLVLHIGEAFSKISEPITLEDGRVTITVQAGASLPKLSNQVARLGLEGLAFASGIPGTIGGALAMNAGAYGGEMKDVILEVKAIDENGESHTFTRDEMELSYRSSRFSKEKLVIVNATFAFAKGDANAIEAEMKSLSLKRREKQPLNVASCGSTFKRPEGNFAAALIEQAGLKGFRVGGASVSEKHAGFLVNDDHATADEYLTLVKKVQQIVHDKSGVWLEPEVHIIGENS